ncbi:hypothetical protein QQ008_20985 [Fulvivirgaceae bacterium BMA10]|uniref:Lipoprotein n=1 Tax=Splendidivirga corallicola TaxID=3051826 RepID=A0ABT8KWS0_9BACT|nr:hypothetical protein [Fulvivirgaceae bacterium BMA10]
MLFKQYSIFYSVLLALLFGCSTTSSTTKTAALNKDQYRIWQFMDKSILLSELKQDDLPANYEILKLNKVNLTKHLSQLEKKEKSRDEVRFERSALEHINFQVPWSDASFHTFVIEKSDAMAPELANNFPDIRSYSGEKQNNESIKVRIDKNPKGLYIMATSPTQTIYVRPLDTESDLYICYDKKDAANKDRQFNEPEMKKN